MLAVTGAATLDGTVGFVTVGGFTPVARDDFTFLLVGTESGDFTNIARTGWSCPLGDTCKDVLGRDSLTLEIRSVSTNVPEPSSLVLLGTGLAAMLTLRVRRRLTRLTHRF